LTADTPKRVALYARNSQPPKGWKPSFPGERPPGSWETQLEGLGTWAEREGYEIVIKEHDVASGRDANRRGWERVLQEARGHHVHAVASTKLDRVMRSAPHFHETANEFLALGVDLIFTEQGTRISKRDPLSKFLIGALALVAELELDLARERTWARLHLGEDGRYYGPRSARPLGRPRKYGEGHRLRRRGRYEVHDRLKCPACRGTKGRGRSAAPVKEGSKA
jgi:DNA invertase Pin-like site-specific DNA recombinase